MNPSPGSDEQYFHREIYDTRLALSTQVYNIYDVERESLKKIKHALQPELAFTYVPEVDQDSLPNVDARDRLENEPASAMPDEHPDLQITQGRGCRAGASDEENVRETITTPGAYDYQDFLRLKVGQYYDFSRNVYNSRTGLHPLSPLDAKLTFSPRHASA